MDTFQKLAKRQRLEKMVRELHQGTRLTKGMFLCTKSVSLFFTSQYVMSPLKCRKEAPIDAAGPSQAKKQKVQKKKKGTPKKKKTPIKKKLKKATADPPTTVVSSLRRLVYED